MSHDETPEFQKPGIGSKMNPNEFKRKYPGFAGYVHDFSDPSDIPNNVEIARRLRADLPDHRRIEVYQEFIPTIERILSNLDREWEAFSLVANRAFGDAGAADKRVPEHAPFFIYGLWSSHGKVPEK